MRIIESRFLRGPNRHCPHSVLQLTADFGMLVRLASTELGAQALGQLRRIAPALSSQPSTDGVAGGFGRELESAAGVPIPWLVLRLAMALIDDSVTTGRSGAITEAGDGSRLEVLLPCEDGEVGQRAWHMASRLVAVAIPGRHAVPVRRLPAPALSERLKRFRALVKARRLDILTEALVAAAHARGIPWMRLSPTSCLVQLGHGCHRHFIQGTSLDTTGHLAYMLAMNKEITARLLTARGLPVPVGIEVSEAEEAASAATRLGFPVVVKPVHGMKGINVAVGLTTAEDVRAAFADVMKFEERALVQKLIAGDDHRLLVVGGRMVAAARRLPAQVTGDGTHTVAQLVDALNADPRRGGGYDKLLVRVTLDKEALRQLRDAGLTPDAVPAAGRSVPLRRTANISRGGTAEDVTDIVHPDNRRLAEEAAQAIGIDLAGVDFITTDISRSHREVGGAILEINPGPGLRPHWVSNPERDVTAPILELLFPGGRNGRVPTAVVTGSAGKTTTCRMVAAILAAAGKTVGLTTTDGVYVGSERVRAGDLAGGHVAQQLLQDPRVEAAVLEIARGGVLKHGFVLDDYDVGAVVNVLDEHVGVEGIDSVEDMARIKRLTVEHAREAAVLNADDPLCRAMIPHARATRLGLVSDRSPPEAALPRLDREGFSVGVDGEGEDARIVLLEAGTRTAVMRVADIPATYAGLARPKVHNAAFAVAIAHGLGLDLAAIRAGLGGFDSSFLQSPGRLNRFEIDGFTVFTDFVPCPTAMQETVRFIDAQRANGKRSVLLTTPGNRTDEHVREMARACAGHFSHYVLYDWDQRRGRKAGEVPDLLRAALIEAGVADDCVTTVLDQREAMDYALRAALPGDLVLVDLPEIDAGTEQILRFGADRPSRPEIAAGDAPAGRQPAGRSRREAAAPGKTRSKADRRKPVA